MIKFQYFIKNLFSCKHAMLRLEAKWLNPLETLNKGMVTKIDQLTKMN